MTGRRGEDAVLRDDDGSMSAAKIPVDIEIRCSFRVANEADWRDVLNALCGLGADCIDDDGTVPEEWKA